MSGAGPSAMTNSISGCAHSAEPVVAALPIGEDRPHEVQVLRDIAYSSSPTALRASARLPKHVDSNDPPASEREDHDARTFDLGLAETALDCGLVHDDDGFTRVYRLHDVGSEAAGECCVEVVKEPLHGCCADDGSRRDEGLGRHAQHDVGVVEVEEGSRVAPVRMPPSPDGRSPRSPATSPTPPGPRL